MRRALTLAARGRGAVEPNPMVGCVIVKDGRTIGEGWHQRFGQPHAEREALAACTEPPAGATAYVTLEPCCHTNKKTPPCVPALIEAGVAKVVVGCLDPNPAVANQGVQQLRAAGIAVETGLLEASCKQLNAPFFAKMLHGRPYVTLKWAQSADGKVAGPAGQRCWISCPESRRLVHELRARCDAILTGINTVLCDDPLLTARDVPNARPLLRIVLDTGLRIPLTSQLVRTAREFPLLIICSQSAHARQPDAVAALAAQNVRVAPLPTGATGRVSLRDAIQHLGTLPITHLLVEPGPMLAKAFLTEGAWDRLWIFRAPAAICDATAPSAAPADYAIAAETTIGVDRLTEMLNPTSGIFHSVEPSADFPRARR